MLDRSFGGVTSALLFGEQKITTSSALAGYAEIFGLSDRCGASRPCLKTAKPTTRALRQQRAMTEPHVANALAHKVDP